MEKRIYAEREEMGILLRFLEESGFKEPSFDLEKEAPPVRLALYDILTAPPQIIDISAPNYLELTSLLTTKTYQFSQEKGGNIPFSAIKETVENLIHANFKAATISVLNNGNTIRVTDQGPGIKDKEKAFEVGFTTATPEMRKIIKGIGHGLPLAKEILASIGGEITIDDNLGKGTVVTLSAPEKSQELIKRDSFPKKIIQNERQKKVLLLIAELGQAGPSRIATELDISLSTAYRDLFLLESAGFLKIDSQGKRGLTEIGLNYLETIMLEGL